MIARLSVKQTELPLDSTEEPQTNIAARVRKAQIFGMVFFLILATAMVIALYYTMGGTWWLALAIWLLMVLSGSVGIVIARKRMKNILRPQK